MQLLYIQIDWRWGHEWLPKYFYWFLVLDILDKVIFWLLCIILYSSLLSFFFLLFFFSLLQTCFWSFSSPHSVIYFFPLFCWNLQFSQVFVVSCVMSFTNDRQICLTIGMYMCFFIIYIKKKKKKKKLMSAVKVNLFYLKREKNPSFYRCLFSDYSPLLLSFPFFGCPQNPLLLS